MCMLMRVYVCTCLEAVEVFSRERHESRDLDLRAFGHDSPRVDQPLAVRLARQEERVRAGSDSRSRVGVGCVR